MGSVTGSRTGSSTGGTGGTGGTSGTGASGATGATGVTFGKTQEVGSSSTGGEINMEAMEKVAQKDIGVLEKLSTSTGGATGVVDGAETGSATGGATGNE